MNFATESCKFFQRPAYSLSCLVSHSTETCTNPYSCIVVRQATQTKHVLSLKLASGNDWITCLWLIKVISYQQRTHVTWS